MGDITGAFPNVGVITHVELKRRLGPIVGGTVPGCGSNISTDSHDQYIRPLVRIDVGRG
jgi:hypothetical protein